MSIGRLLAWTLVAFTGFLPLNWFRLWAIGEAAAGSTLGQFLIGTLVSWGIAGALGFFLVISARGIKRGTAKEDQEFELARRFVRLARHAAAQAADDHGSEGEFSQGAATPAALNAAAFAAVRDAARRLNVSPAVVTPAPASSAA